MLWCIYRHCDSYEDRNENMTYLASQLTKWHNQKRAVIFFQTRETCKHKTRLCYILCLRRSQTFVPCHVRAGATPSLPVASGSLGGNSQQSRLHADVLRGYTRLNTLEMETQEQHSFLCGWQDRISERVLWYFGEKSDKIMWYQEKNTVLMSHLPDVSFCSEILLKIKNPLWYCADLGELQFCYAQSRVAKWNPIAVFRALWCLGSHYLYNTFLDNSAEGLKTFSGTEQNTRRTLQNF